MEHDKNLSIDILSKLTIFSKYAKYIPSLNRRETWDEICDRVEDMHARKYPDLVDDIKRAMGFVRAKKVVPSMRSMQFAGKPIEINNARIFNCAFTAVQTWKDFSEVMLMLLGGCFDPDTLVKTKHGDKRLSEITLYDEVLTYDVERDEYYWIHPSVVLETLSATKDKIEIEFEDGSVVRCTSDHKFYTKNRGWVEAKDLTDDDDIENYTS